MYLLLIIKSMLAGFIVAAPTGPVSMRAIEKAVNHGKKTGISAGMGIITADDIFALLVSLGCTQVSYLIEQHRGFFQLANVLFLGLFLIYTLFKNQKNNKMKTLKGKAFSSRKEFKQSLMLCLSNPSTIITFLMLFNLLEITISNRPVLSTACIVSGLLFGAVSVWILIIRTVNNPKYNIVNLFKKHMQGLSISLIALLLFISSYQFLQTIRVSFFA